MNRSVFILILFLSWATVGLGDDRGPVPPRFPTSKITAEQIDAYKAEVEALPDAGCREIWAHQQQCWSDAQHTMWIFTLPGHPAHPAVSRGVMVVTADSEKKTSTIGIDRSGHYAGDAEAFEKWMSEFAVLDQRQLAVWQNALRHDP